MTEQTPAIAGWIGRIQKEAKQGALQWAKERIQQGQCAIVEGWCLTHRTNDSPEHSAQTHGTTMD